MTFTTSMYFTFSFFLSKVSPFSFRFTVFGFGFSYVADFKFRFSYSYYGLLLLCIRGSRGSVACFGSIQHVFVFLSLDLELDTPHCVVHSCHALLIAGLNLCRPMSVVSRHLPTLFPLRCETHPYLMGTLIGYWWIQNPPDLM